MTPEELAARVAPWRRAQARADALVPDRDAAIIEAVDAGMSARRVAKVVGLSPDRPRQIVIAHTKRDLIARPPLVRQGCGTAGR